MFARDNCLVVHILSGVLRSSFNQHFILLIAPLQPRIMKILFIFPRKMYEHLMFAKKIKTNRVNCQQNRHTP